MVGFRFTAPGYTPPTFVPHTIYTVRRFTVRLGTIPLGQCAYPGGSPRDYHQAYPPLGGFGKMVARTGSSVKNGKKGRLPGSPKGKWRSAVLCSFRLHLGTGRHGGLVL
jgi:hypothetical protein